MLILPAVKEEVENKMIYYKYVIGSDIFTILGEVIG